MNLSTAVSKKFQNPKVTAKGEQRAWVDLKQLKTLWFNTGTLCNLECKSCYIESSPKNDRLVYITKDDVLFYLDEIENNNLGTTEIAFTGGEPFMNKAMIEISKLCLSRGYEVLVLTNAMKPMQKYKDQLLELNRNYKNKLHLRVSMDHYSQKLHEAERGLKSWAPALDGLQWLSDNAFPISVAGRTCWGESDEQMRKGYETFFKANNIQINAWNPESLILFPEMDESAEVPEITTDCWNILKVNPDTMMCASSRMVVKRKGSMGPSVAACTLLPYDEQFDLGSTLTEASQSVPLNHPHCAKFCVLGGGSCTG